MQNPYQQNEYSEQGQSDIWHRRFHALREMRQRTTAVDLVSNRGNRYVVARCAGERFALPLQAVSEVVPLTPGQTRISLPGAPTEFWGLLLVRGEVRPVFDVRLLLSVSAGNTESETGTGHIVFVRSSERDQDRETVGLKVDHVENIVLVLEEETRPALVDGSRPGKFVQRLQTGNSDTGSLFFLDMTALLNSLRGNTREPSGTIASVEPEAMSIQSDTRRPPGIEEE